MKNCLIRTFLRRPAMEELIDTLREKYNVISLEPGTSEKFTDQELENAEIVIGNISLSALKKCKNLKWLQLSSSGADNYAKSDAIDKNRTVITNATGAYGAAISEYMVAGVMSLVKKFNLYRDQQFKGSWYDNGFVKTIAGSEVLVIGLGDIGGNFAQRMNALGAKVKGIKRNIGKKPDYVDGIYTLDELDRLLPRADIVALCLPNTPRTTKVLGERQFSLMNPESVLINVGRGTSIDTDALTQALHNKNIAGAVLDVTDPEPLPPDHPLWQEKNAIITPHIAGGYHSIEIIQSIETIINENARRYIEGKELINIVDYETGYRKSI